MFFNQNSILQPKYVFAPVLEHLLNEILHCKLLSRSLVETGVVLLHVVVTDVLYFYRLVLFNSFQVDLRVEVYLDNVILLVFFLLYPCEGVLVVSVCNLVFIRVLVLSVPGVEVGKVGKLRESLSRMLHFHLHLIQTLVIQNLLSIIVFLFFEEAIVIV
jgi:hypothetical protein